MIDSHHHFWNFGEDEQTWRSAAHEAIARDFGPDDLEPELRAAGVDATVLVQSVDTAAENERLLRYAADIPFVAGVVAWLPLRSARAARPSIPALKEHETVRGVRCLIGRDHTDWLTAAETLGTFRDLAAAQLSWDVVPVTADQVSDVVAVARAVPGLRIVVDHLARPPIEAGGWQPWADQVRALAESPNIAVKVSVGIDVLTGWSQWNADRLTRYVDRVARQFGPERMMLASNWPVVLLRRSYRQAWSDLAGAVAASGISSPDLAAVTGGTAARWYSLTV
ncbi:MAG TPA: amidohydrolase family protein [Mycobacteriales bacterium]|nr:amidohydrolase family protein [Mycobacteriales bacterium]